MFPAAIDLSGLGMQGQGLSHLLTALTGLPARSALLTAAAVFALALLIFVFKDQRFRTNGKQVIGGDDEMAATLSTATRSS
jgi:hypothetical protein